jgi:hypothetical protein
LLAAKTAGGLPAFLQNFTGRAALLRRLLGNLSFRKGHFVMLAQTAPRSNQVRAVFQDATMFAFDLDRETTFGQLAEEIEKLAECHGRLFLPVHVRLARGR